MKRLKPGDRVCVVRNTLHPHQEETCDSFLGSLGVVVSVEPFGPLPVRVALDTIKAGGKGATFWFDEDELQGIGKQKP